MKREEDKELWDLLGRAGKTPELSPFFARNVLRQVRTEAQPRESAWSWLRPAILIPSTAVAITLLAAAVTLQTPPQVAEVADPIPDLIAQLDPQDFQVVADLDILMAWEEETWWEDT
jgi:hypothetical protein